MGPCGDTKTIEYIPQSVFDKKQKIDDRQEGIRCT